MASKTVSVGTTFRSIYMDGNYTWVVAKRIGGSPLTWLCEITDEYETGTQKTFLDSEIKAKLRSAEGFQRIMDDRETFWNDQKVGTIYHYNNGFGNYVRGVIVDHQDKKQFKATALVGSWSESDYRPKVSADGEVRLSYHAKGVLNGDHIWQPDTSCIWEASDNQKIRYPDPRLMEALDLSIPESNEDEKTEAALWQKVNEVRKLLEFTNDCIQSDGKSATELLADIRKVVGKGPAMELFNF